MLSFLFIALARLSFAFPQPYESTILSREAEQQSSDWSGPRGPIHTLLPAVHWDNDGSDLVKLTPLDTTTFYYTDSGTADASVKHVFSNVIATYAKPAVVLEQSNQINSIQCTASGFQVTFTSDAAFDHAEDLWTQTDNFLIVSHTTNCTKDSDGQRAFFDVKKLQFAKVSLSVHVTAEEIDLTEAVTDMELAWGTYEPTPIQASSVLKRAACAAVAPSPTISGFPAEGCSDNFDLALDNDIGYIDFTSGDDAAAFNEFAPGLDIPVADFDNYGDIEGENYTTETTTKRDLNRVGHYSSSRVQKRWWFFNKIVAVFQKAAEVVVSVVKTTVTAVASAVTTVAAAAKGAVDFVVDTVKNGFHPTIDTTIPIYIGPTPLVDSPFGPAYTLFAGEKSSKKNTTTAAIALYCVDCGITGKIHVAGGVRFSILAGGLTQGNISMVGNLAAGLNLGLHAEIVYTAPEKKKTLYTQGAPGFSIPKIIVVGPEIALEARFAFSVGAYGDALLGAKLNFANFNATLDLVNKNQSQRSGFDPVLTTTFTASGTIAANAVLGFPLSVGVGIDLIPINFRKLIALVNEPSVNAGITYSTSGTCAGIAYELHVEDDTRVDFFGVSEIHLYKYVSPALISGCVALSKRESVNAEYREVEEDLDRSLWPRLTIDPPPQSYEGNIVVAQAAAPVPTRAPTRITYEPARRQASSSVMISPPAAVSLSPDNNADSALFQTLEVDAAAEEAMIIAEGQMNEDGFVYNSIADQTGAYMLSSDSDNNLRLQAAGAVSGGVMFASYDNVTISDAAERVFFFYPDVMEAFGISRFRIANFLQLPLTSDLITLVPVNTDGSSSTAGIYMAVSSEGNYYYPMACNFEDANKPAKLFLASDPTAGAATLQSNGDISYIITGGDVTACSFVALMSVGAGMS